MLLRRLHITTFAATVLLAGAIALADDADGSGLTRPPAGSIARQLRLKMTLHRITPAGSLVAALKHNRQEWESLTPDQRGSFRKNFLAFLHKSADEQEKILSQYEKLFKMTTERPDAYRQRAKWLGVVVQSLRALVMAWAPTCSRAWIRGRGRFSSPTPAGGRPGAARPLSSWPRRRRVRAASRR